MEKKIEQFCPYCAKHVRTGYAETEEAARESNQTIAGFAKYRCDCPMKVDISELTCREASTK